MTDRLLTIAVLVCAALGAAAALFGVHQRASLRAEVDRVIAEGDAQVERLARTRQALMAACVADGGEPVSDFRGVACLRKRAEDGAPVVLWRRAE